MEPAGQQQGCRGRVIQERGEGHSHFVVFDRFQTAGFGNRLIDEKVASTTDATS
jgi:hypothetical protein